MNRAPALVAYRAFSDVAGKGAFFLITVFAARTLSQHGFGIFSIGTTLGWIAAVATDFGIQLHVARAVAERPGDAQRLLHGWWRVRVGTSAIALVLIAIGLLASRAAWSSRLAVLVLAVVYLLGGLIEFLHYVYRGLSRSDIESTLTLCQRFGMLVCAGAVLAVRPDVATLAVALLIPSVATLAYSLRCARRMVTPPNLAVEASRPASEEGHLTASRSVLRDVIPLGAGIVLSALYFRIDVFLIEMWQGTNAVALYNAVFRLVDALRLFPAAVLAVTLPALVRATSARPLVSVSALVTAFSLVVATGLWIVADWVVLVLYGGRYADAVPAFKILLASLPLMSLNYALTHQLVGWNGHRAWAAISAAALVFNIALNVRLIPVLSISGAAWATLGTEMMLTAGCATVLWTRLSRSSEGPQTVAAAP